MQKKSKVVAPLPGYSFRLFGGLMGGAILGYYPHPHMGRLKLNPLPLYGDIVLVCICLERYDTDIYV